MRKVLSLVLSLVMLLSLVVPVSAEDTTFEGSGTLKDKTAVFTIEADKTTLYDTGEEQVVKFHIYVESESKVPIRAFQFTLEPSANLTLADTTMEEDGAFYYALQKNLSTNGNPGGMYSQIAYTPSSRYFGAAGTDDAQGITTKTEIMTIMGKVSGVGDYTLSMSGVVAGNGDAPDSVTQKFTSTVTGAAVTVKHASERPQQNLSLTLSTNTVKVGDTFTATLSNKGMNIISLVAQMRFNTDVLEVVSITENEGYTNLAKDAKAAVISTVADANDKGTVGMSIVHTDEHQYSAQNIVTVTFKAKAAGDGWIKVDESTDGTNGTDGYLGDAIVNSVTIEKPAYVLGDVNEDGKINMTDVNRLFRCTTRKEISLTEAQLAAADVTGDGKVNITDVNRLFKFVTKQITTL